MKNLFCLFLFCCLCCSCVKKECNFIGSYEFKVALTLSPSKTTFKIGDTITIKSVFSDDVYETNTDQRYYLENYYFGISAKIYNLETSGLQPRLDAFDMLVDSSYYFGTWQDNDGVQLDYGGEFLYEDSTYSFEYKLVAQKEGLYVIIHDPGTFLVPNEHEFEGKCKLKSSNRFYVLNEGAVNNIDLLEKSPEPHFNDWMLRDPEKFFYNRGSYCFYVTE